MILRIDGDIDIETVRLDVAEHLNEIENFENATVTGIHFHHIYRILCFLFNKKR